MNAWTSQQVGLKARLHVLRGAWQWCKRMGTECMMKAARDETDILQELCGNGVLWQDAMA